MALNFEWDANKAKSNLGKHGISFEAPNAFGVRRSAFVDHSRSDAFGLGKSFHHSRSFASGQVASCRAHRKRRQYSELSARESRADENDGVMKKARGKNDEMLREYDFSQGVRGKYAQRYARGSNVVVLEPDVAKIFPNAEPVNSSLRSLAEILRRRKSLASK
jgi:uncharacterized DUF497 family protein